MTVDGKQIYRKLASIIGEGPDKKSYLGEDDFVEVFHRHIRLCYHLKNPIVDLPKVLGTIRRIHEKLAHCLRLTIGRVEVEIYASREQWIERHTRINAHDLPSWVQADSGRVVRIYMGKKNWTTEKLQLVLTHECVHNALARHVGKPLPAWLDEGLALYFSQDLPTSYQAQLSAAVAGDALLPLELLVQPFTRMDRRMQKLAYAQSSSLVGYLVERYRWDMIRDLLAAFKRGDALAATLTRFQTTVYLLEADWKKTLRSSV